MYTHTLLYTATIPSDYTSNSAAYFLEMSSSDRQPLTRAHADRFLTSKEYKRTFSDVFLHLKRPMTGWNPIKTKTAGEKKN